MHMELKGLTQKAIKWYRKRESTSSIKTHGGKEDYKEMPLLKRWKGKKIESSPIIKSKDVIASPFETCERI